MDKLSRSYVETLLENDREWRRFMIEEIQVIQKDIFALRAWSLVFRLAGSAAFAIILIWIEFKLNNGG